MVVLEFVNSDHLPKAAQRGEPSHVWRSGQQRRLALIRAAAGERLKGTVLVDGCGVGMYLAHLKAEGARAIGLDIEFGRVVEARQHVEQVLCAAGEYLPFPAQLFDLVLSHEVLEHVADDRSTIEEMVRSLRPGGRLVLFVPNRGYPFETHGVFWRGKYTFGNIPLVNYLPRRWRDQLAPHVRIYARRDLEDLFTGLPVSFIHRTIIFGGYDNIIARFGLLGKALRAVLQALERTPLRSLGLSHVWVVEKLAGPG